MLGAEQRTTHKSEERRRREEAITRFTHLPSSPLLPVLRRLLLAVLQRLQAVIQRKGELHGKKRIQCLVCFVKKADTDMHIAIRSPPLSDEGSCVGRRWVILRGRAEKALREGEGGRGETEEGDPLRVPHLKSLFTPFSLASLAKSQCGLEGLVERRRHKGVGERKKLQCAHYFAIRLSR